MGSGRFQPLKSRKSRLLRRPQGILPDRLLGSSVERMHLAAKLEFERTVRESARWRAVPEPSDRQLPCGGGAQRLLFEQSKKRCRRCGAPAWNNRCRLLVPLVRLS